MLMMRSNVQVQSIDAFTCQEFRQIFENNRQHGSITTQDNGRKYHVVWDDSTDSISVKRDLTNVGMWTRFSEVLDRWSQFDFTTHAEKLANRLTIQKHNVALAEPLKKKVVELCKQLEGINSDVESCLSGDKGIKEHSKSTSHSLTELLEEKRLSLYKHGRQLLDSVGQNLISDQHLDTEQEIRNSIDSLQEQTRQLILFINQITLLVGAYSTALGTIKESNNPLVYRAFIKRLDASGIQLKQFINNYFNASGKWSKEEDAQFRAFLINERNATSIFGYNEKFAFIPRNELNEDEDESFKYEDQLITLITLLVDPQKAADEIQAVAASFKVIENIS